MLESWEEKKKKKSTQILGIKFKTLHHLSRLASYHEPFVMKV